MAEIVCAYNSKHTVMSTYATVVHDKDIIRIPVHICVDKECVAKRGGTITENVVGHFQGRPKVNAI